MKNIQTYLIFALLSIFVAGCKSLPPQPQEQAQNIFVEAPVVTKQAGEISVMTYNVENLFDTQHDVGTEDYANMPAAVKAKDKQAQKFCKAVKNPYYQKECFDLDWNEEVLKAKLKNIGDVIKYVDGGKGPDNLLMAEVENIKVIKLLIKTQLKDLGYQTAVLIEGPDLRGIDPAFISKFPMVGKPKLHLIPYVDKDPEQLKWAKRSRGILEVTVKAPNNKNITFLAAHFPSQSNPTAWRAQAVQFAKNLMLDYQKKGRAVIFGGDLNIITTEEAKENYFKNEFSQAGQVSHLVGCTKCLGSHNYRGEWSFLDVMVFSHNLKTVGFELIPESLMVVRSPINVKPDGVPMRFDNKLKTGASDHLPLYSRLRAF